MEIRCVAGLGNPGPRYEWTRHNAGFWVVERIARQYGLPWLRLATAFEARGDIEGRRVALLRPHTFMNRSGEAVLECMERCRLLPGELLVVVDDVALPAGRLRLREGGSSGGHRGLISVEEALGTTEYARLRIGVGGAAPGEDLAEFVLRPLGAEEKSLFEGMAERGADVVRTVLTAGLTRAMNEFNPPPREEGAAPAGPRADRSDDN
jgi:peptidyl-tRNA hydrolase, PTH1 family